MIPNVSAILHWLGARGLNRFYLAKGKQWDKISNSIDYYLLFIHSNNRDSENITHRNKKDLLVHLTGYCEPNNQKQTSTSLSRIKFTAAWNCLPVLQNTVRTQWNHHYTDRQAIIIQTEPSGSSVTSQQAGSSNSARLVTHAVIIINTPVGKQVATSNKLTW